jgi:hypothetical protein
MMAGLLLLAFPFAEGTVAAPDAPSPAASAAENTGSARIGLRFTTR